MVLGRRLLVLVALMFWQGGFTFYAAVVVPTGQRVLASHLRQGLITRLVTNYLNLAGAFALAVLASDIVTENRRRHARWAAWLLMTVTLMLLIWLHGRLDSRMDPQTPALFDREGFRLEHRIYLWVSTLQWAAAIVYAWLTLRAWREHDSAGAGYVAQRAS